MEKYIGGLRIVEAEHTESFEVEFEEMTVAKPEGYLIKKAGSDVLEYMPKAPFESMFTKLVKNPSLNSGLSISQDIVDSFILKTFVSKQGEKTTLVRAVLVNGYEICETSSCADPFNYKEDIGYSECMCKIKNKIWEHLGFMLCSAINGFGILEREE